ncbi:MAG: ABC transporter substrate-binding protein [Chloroflexi bacterium]|nr:ABC transporter substrate-binding protein [Chloroflexota bacterium]
MRTSRFVPAVLLIAMLAVSACAPKAAEPVKIRIGTQPWIGYGPWWIAQEKGMFTAHGLDVELVDFVQDTEVNAAFASGEMDAANLATHTAIKLFANGVDLKVVLLEDASYEADAMMAGPDVQSIADLAGKSVAYEEGSTSDLLLNYALSQNGMSLADISPAPMPASDAGSALIAGQVAAAVTYEPYISAALAENSDLHVVYTAGERPGLISDVFVISGKFASENPEAAKELLKVWDEAMAFYKSNPDEAKGIIATAVGSAPEELTTAFDGVQFYDLAENRSQLTGDFAATIEDVANVSMSIGLFDSIPDLKALVDASFLGE